MEIRNMSIKQLHEVRAEQVEKADKAISEEKPDEAKDLIEQIKKLDERITALENGEEPENTNEGEERRMNNFVKPNIEGNNKSHEVRSFENYINSLGKDTEIRNTTLSTNAGVIVPDIMTDVTVKTENVLDLKSIVNTIKVDSGEGTVPFLKSQAPILPTVEELAENPLLAAEPIVEIPFAVNTHRSYLLISNEMRQDSKSDLIPMLQDYLKRAVVNTDNDLILKQLATLTAKQSANGVDEIKRVLNVDLLANGYDQLTIVINASTYQILDTLKTTNGDYVLQNNVGEKPYSTLNGVPIIVVNDAQLPANRVYIGDFKKAVALFDRAEAMVSYEEYLTYSNALAIAIRRDSKIVDEEAVISLDLTFEAEPVAEPANVQVNTTQNDAEVSAE